MKSYSQSRDCITMVRIDFQCIFPLVNSLLLIPYFKETESEAVWSFKMLWVCLYHVLK